MGTHIHYPQGCTLVQSDFDQQEILSQARNFSQERFRSEWRGFFARKGIRVPMGYRILDSFLSRSAESTSLIERYAV
jgi:hypothetical protein